MIDGGEMRAGLRDIFVRLQQIKGCAPTHITISPEAFEAIKRDIEQNERLMPVPPPEWSHALQFKGSYLVADVNLSGERSNFIYA